MSDLDPTVADRIARSCCGSVIAPEDVSSTECDVYAPCAVGATLNSRTIPVLACSIVAGAANNQLEEPGDAERLSARGILYAPDYVINGGGAMAFTLIYQGLSPIAAVEERVVDIGQRLKAIFEESKRTGRSPVVVARDRAEETLRRGPVDDGLSTFGDIKGRFAGDH